MLILLKRRSGEITPFRNADFIPAFYFIPKSILDKCGSELNSIPRNPRKLLQNRDAIAMVESDLFLLAIIDAYAYMVWPFMGLGAKREIYSGYEPSWIFAHAAPYWIQEMQEEKILPAAKELLKLFTSLNQDGQTILMVTHSVKAASTAGRVLFIKDGRVFHQIYKGNLSETQMYQKISTSCR